MTNEEHRARAKAALERFIARPKTRPRPYPGYSRVLFKNHTPEETFEIIAEDGKLPFEPEEEGQVKDGDPSRDAHARG